MMGDGVKPILAKPIQLADQVIKWADYAHYNKEECGILKSQTERLAVLLRQAARADLYERPTRRIMDDTEQVLDKALTLISKCRSGGLMNRVFGVPATGFKKLFTLLDNSAGDVSWLLRVSAAAADGDDEGQHLGLPPIAQNEPILFLIWEQIATLSTGSLEARTDAAASLVSLARDNDRYVKLIIEEDGVGPLLRLLKDGGIDGQEAAARAIGLLARDADCVEQMVVSGVCSVFAKVLKDGPMKVQSVVAWAVSELADRHPRCQDVFAQDNVIRLLVSHLAFETVQEHSKYTIPSKVTSIHSAVLANNTTGNTNSNSATTDRPENNLQIKHPMGSGSGSGSGSQSQSQSQNQSNKNQMHSVVQSTMAKSSKNHQAPANHSHQNGGNGIIHGARHSNISLGGASIKGREFEDPETKAYMKAMSARALWHLARGNPAICKSITESRALLCFAVLLEKGADEVKYNSAMALMEICHVAEQNADLRRSAFKPNSLAARAVLDQLLRIVEKADDDDLLWPCVVSLGCLSRTFRATETRIIGPLVRLLDEREGVLEREVVVALTKFACSENYLHLDHSKAIIAAGGAKHLVQLVYFADQAAVKTAALVLLCYVAHHVPDSEALAQADVLTVLEWASKQSSLMQDPVVDGLLPEAKIRLELYQSRGARGYY